MQKVVDIFISHINFTSMFSRRDTQSDFFKNSLGMFFLDFREPVVDKSVRSLAERASQHTELELT